MADRTTPLPENEDRFERFYIRYDVETTEGSLCSLTVEVWETCEWRDGKPVFFNGGPNAPGMDPAAITPLFELVTKWDGCSHLRMPYLHFDDLDELDAVKRCVEYIWNDIRDRESVVDN